MESRNGGVLAIIIRVLDLVSGYETFFFLPQVLHANSLLL